MSSLTRSPVVVFCRPAHHTGCTLERVGMAFVTTPVADTDGDIHTKR